MATTSPMVAPRACHETPAAPANHQIENRAMSLWHHITFLSAEPISFSRVTTNRKPGIPRRLNLGVWLLAAAFSSCLPAQDTLAMTRISASAADAVFIVDGQPFTGAAVFSWPAGSKHTLEIAVAQNMPSLPKGRYVFGHWSSPLGPLASPSNIVTVSADPGIPWYRADLTTEYTVSLVFFQCTDSPCASPGTIFVNRMAYQQSADVWLAAGSPVMLEASPNPGFVFAGWWQGGNQAPVYTFVLNAAIAVYPRFAVARAIHLLTSPDGLQLLVDRALVTTPLTLDWGLDTSHSLSPVSPQSDQQGRQWVFRAWVDGGDRSRTFLVPSGPSEISIVAQFVPAVSAVLLTDPAGLSLTMDGLDGPSPRFSSWGPGESHIVTAPAHQIDSAGGPWAFREWSNGLLRTQTIQVTNQDAGLGIRMTAAYDPLSRIRIESAPSGLTLAVDGADCRTPCEVERAVGSAVHLSGPVSIGVSDGVRLDFGSWEGIPGATFTTTAGYRKVTAHYQWSYLLALSTSPVHAGAWRLAPASTDGFYAAGSTVSVGIDAASGMKFRQWGQDLSGSANPMTLVMNGPHMVQALMDPVPDTPPPPHIGNAAGETPTVAVAPGSIAVLFGSDLASDTISSMADPLPQSLAGVTLVCAGHLLPLLFVSPQQINFQLPADLKPGRSQLELHRGNAPVVIVDFETARNAPGLLAATHLDGSPVTSDSPAHLGETVTLYGTGFGPYQLTPLDGFRVPQVPSFVLADAVGVIVPGRQVSPDLAVAAPGMVGIAIVRFRIPEDLDLSIPATVVVGAGDILSNAIPLYLK